MDHFQKRLALTGVLLLGLPLFGASSAFAATPVNLSHQQLSILQSFVSGTEVHETSRAVSRSKTTHIRIQQTYQGYKVWGADAVIHVPNSGQALRNSDLQTVMRGSHARANMNGIIYQGIEKDLAKTRQSALSNTQADKAMNLAIENYAHKVGGKPAITEQKTTQIIFIDKAHKAHWAYLVSFDAAAIREGELPAKPAMIMDAETLQVYMQWNDIKTIDLKKPSEAGEVAGGGFGGNKKMGKLVYDGLKGDLHYAKLLVTRDAVTKNCTMENSDVVVKNYATSKKPSKIMSFQCDAPNKENGLYWDADLDKVNEGFSPSNDALFGGNVIKSMYRDWYDVPVLTDSKGKPLLLTMVVHDPIDNAYWDGRKMTFGDGVTMFYPLTSLGVAAHEISHGFTEQHSGLNYSEQSGGMNEAFSDMAAQAAEFYAYGKNTWQIGPEIFKAKNRALRYLDKPSTDCQGKEPGNWCSIDSADQYYDGLDVHFSSGVFNRAFYLMGTAEGWDARKAFDVMVHANENYWTSNSTFSQGACGAVAAAKDLGYDTAVVEQAFTGVKVDFTDCSGSSDDDSDSDDDMGKLAK